MVHPQDNTPARDPGMTTWEDDGGCFQADAPQRDLNSLLAQEQMSIMHAESAATLSGYELHRDASLHTRQLINATPYPEHEPHSFSRERAEKADDHDEALRALIKSVEANEQLLADQFADGKVSVKSSQVRSRSLRQDRARLADMSPVDRAGKGS